MHDHHVYAGDGSWPRVTLRRRLRTALAIAVGICILLGPPGVGWSDSPTPTVGGEPAQLSRALPGFLDSLRAAHRILAPAGWDDWVLSIDSKDCRARLSWLAKDFRAPAFRRADRVDEARINRSTGEASLHLGILAVHFRSGKELDKAIKAVRKCARSNFALPVLTAFQLNTRAREMVFVFSETPTHPRIEELLRESKDSAVITPQ
jgi:hypothetical protein